LSREKERENLSNKEGCIQGKEGRNPNSRDKGFIFVFMVPLSLSLEEGG